MATTLWTRMPLTPFLAGLLAIRIGCSDSTGPLGNRPVGCSDSTGPLGNWPVGCSDSTGPLGNWPGGITSRVAYASITGEFPAYQESLYVAASPEAPPIGVAAVADFVDPRFTVLNKPGGWPQWLAWHPRAKQLALSLWKPQGTAFLQTTWLLDARTGAKPSLAGDVQDFTSTEEWYPAWAPDGRLGSCRNFVVVLAGTAVLGSPACDGSFDVSPDGSWLVVSNRIERRLSGYNEIYVIGLHRVSLVGAAPRTAVLVVDTVVRGYAPWCEQCPPPPSLHPTISPGGDRIAFVRPRPLAGSIWLVGSDGSGLRAVTAGPVDQGPVGWSRDGAWLMFLRGSNEFHATRVDGSETQLLLTTAGYVISFAWSRQ